MSIFSFSKTLVVSNGDIDFQTPLGGSSNFSYLPEDCHIINMTGNNFIAVQTEIPEHGLIIAGGYDPYGSSLYSSDSSMSDIFSVLSTDVQDKVFEIDKTTGNAFAQYTLSANSYSNLPKWLSKLEKTAAWQVKATYNDGSYGYLNFTAPGVNITGKIGQAAENSIGWLEVVAESVPYNGTITLNAIATGSHYPYNSSDSFLVTDGMGDVWVKGAFISERNTYSPFYLTIVNANGNKLYEGYISARYVNISIGTQLIFENGSFKDRK